MIDINLHAEKLLHGLALHRFYIHLDEVKRALQPILQDVYNIGYDRGLADSANNIVNIPPDTLQGTVENLVSPVGTMEATAEVVHHEPVEDVKENIPIEEENVH